MKNILTFIFLTSTVCLFAQQTDTTKTEMTDTTKIVSLITKFDEVKMACKDGYFIDGYIVNINFDQAKMLDGKKIKVTCSGKNYYTNSLMYKNQNVKLSNDKFKDGKLLTRLLKLSELESKSQNYEL